MRRNCNDGELALKFRPNFIIKPLDIFKLNVIKKTANFISVIYNSSSVARLISFLLLEWIFAGEGVLSE